MNETQAEKLCEKLNWDVDGAKCKPVYLFSTGRYGVLVEWLREFKWRETTVVMDVEAAVVFLQVYGGQVYPAVEV
jgi:hypothetical protein